jgi:hypothetical protein
MVGPRWSRPHSPYGSIPTNGLAKHERLLELGELIGWASSGMTPDAVSRDKADAARDMRPRPYALGLLRFIPRN